jgi:YhcH/YjgK/YiaL family protein
MIYDTHENAPRYFSIHPHFETAFNWLQENPNAPEGKYEIVGGDCFVMIQAASGQGGSTPTLEAHNEYLDIQIALSGTDEIGWKSRAACTHISQEYSEEKDLILWREEPDFPVALAPGAFVILFPSDAHAPLSGIGEVKKAVFKLRANVKK